VGSILSATATAAAAARATAGAHSNHNHIHDHKYNAIKYIIRPHVSNREELAVG
jgi:hypothetical protein